MPSLSVLVPWVQNTINGQAQDVAKPVMAASGGRGVHVEFETVGARLWSSTMKSLVRGGLLVACGASTGDQQPADLRHIFIRRLQFLSSTLGDFDELRNLLGFVQRTAPHRPPTRDRQRIRTRPGTRRAGTPGAGQAVRQSSFAH